MEYLPFETFILRTPVLPVETVEMLTSDDIRKLCMDPWVAAAIALASPVLEKEMPKYLDHSLPKKEHDRLEFSLLKYLLRMGYRCTPFGLFSGCSVGKITSVSEIELDDRGTFKTATELDMHFLCSWVMEIEKDRELRGKLRFQHNNTIYRVGAEFRYVEYRYIDSQRKHFVVSVAVTEYLGCILDKAKKVGGATLEELASAIVGDGIFIEDAVEFVNQLIDNQLLVSSISPILTGTAYLDRLSRELSGTKYEEVLHIVVSQLESIDSPANIDRMGQKRELMQFLIGMHGGADSKFLLQTNLYANAIKASISKSLVDQISGALRVINRLREPYKNNRLENFKKAFQQRYETEEIPLAIALDVEIGIGYGKERDSFSISPLVDDLYFPAYAEGNSNQINWNRVDHYLYHKIDAFSKDATSDCIIIRDDEIISFKEDWDALPSTFSVLASIVSMAGNEAGEAQVYIDYVGGSSACNLLSRFSSLDQKIEDFLHEIAAKENDGEFIYAEIAHLPEARTGNILHRPHLRSHEIPYLASTAIDPEFRIEVEDIFISVRDDKIVLRSRRHGKEILPMLSNAHYYLYNSLPVYYFLCDMQNQHTRNGLNLNIGNLKTFFDFIPRIMYGNVILSPAQWILKAGEISKIKDREGLLKAFMSRQIPSKVVFSEGDNELLINCESQLSVEMFLTVIKGKDRIELKEFLFDRDNALVRRGTETFTNEVVFSFYKSI